MIDKIFYNFFAMIDNICDKIFISFPSEKDKKDNGRTNR